MSTKRSHILKQTRKVNFNDNLKLFFTINTVPSCRQFNQIFCNALDKHARKLLTASCYAYISKSLRRAITRRYLKKFIAKPNLKKVPKAYKKQKNVCSRLHKKEGERFFNNLNPSFLPIASYYG